MSGYTYPTYGMLPEEMVPYHRHANMPMNRGAQQFISGTGLSNTSTGAAMSPIRSSTTTSKIPRPSVPIDGYIYQVERCTRERKKCYLLANLLFK